MAHRISLFAALLLAGCGSPWRVQLQGEVRGVDPGQAPPGVHRLDAVLQELTWSEVAPASTTLDAAEAELEVWLEGEDAPALRERLACLREERALRLHVDRAGRGPLSRVVLRVRAPGRAPVQRELPADPGGPDGERQVAVGVVALLPPAR